MKKPDIIFEILFKLCLLVFAVVLIIVSQAYSRDSRMLPELLGAAIILLLLLSAATEFFIQKGLQHERRTDGSDQDAASATASYRKRLYWTSLVVVASLVGACIGGVLLAVPIGFIAFAASSRRRKDFVTSVYLSAIFTALVYVVFRYILYVPVLKGLLHEYGLF